MLDIGMGCTHSYDIPPRWGFFVVKRIKSKIEITLPISPEVAGYKTLQSFQWNFSNSS